MNESSKTAVCILACNTVSFKYHNSYLPRVVEFFNHDDNALIWEALQKLIQYNII